MSVKSNSSLIFSHKGIKTLDRSKVEINIRILCVPAEHIMGKRMFPGKQRSVGTHGATLGLIDCTKRSDGTLISFTFYHSTHEMSLQDNWSIRNLLSSEPNVQECDATKLIVECRLPP